VLDLWDDSTHDVEGFSMVFSKLFNWELSWTAEVWLPDLLCTCIHTQCHKKYKLTRGEPKQIYIFNTEMMHNPIAMGTITVSCTSRFYIRLTAF
jgi:hypothetical protein